MAGIEGGSGEKIAIVLFNLGGPDSQASVKPFLYNFFTDPNIIGLPAPLRHLLSYMIASKRSKKEAGSAYSLLGWQSPLLRNSQMQAAALEAALNGSGNHQVFKCFVCMRYWHPMAPDVVREVQAFVPDRIILLPLYPQYSTTTTKSSFEVSMREARRGGLRQPVSAICCYPFNDGFIQASAGRIRTVLDQVTYEAREKGWRKPRLLFSAHGLPEKIIASGDPYQWQCEQSATRIAAAVGEDDLDWQICYQSRVGPLKWIGPSTVEALEKAASDKVPVVIYPHAFVSEHVETLVEIEIEYRHLAETLGIPCFARVGTVMDDALFIDGLKRAVLSGCDRSGVSSDEGGRLCPEGRNACCMASGIGKD